MSNSQRSGKFSKLKLKVTGNQKCQITQFLAHKSPEKITPSDNDNEQNNIKTDGISNNSLSENETNKVTKPIFNEEQITTDIDKNYEANNNSLRKSTLDSNKIKKTACTLNSAKNASTNLIKQFFTTTEETTDDSLCDFQNKPVNRLIPKRQPIIKNTNIKKKCNTKRRKQQDIRKIINKQNKLTENELFSEILLEHSNREGVDPEQLQLALALSKSMVDEKETAITRTSSSASSSSLTCNINRFQEAINSLGNFKFNGKLEKLTDSSTMENLFDLKPYKRQKWSKKITPLTRRNIKKQEIKLETKINQIIKFNENTMLDNVNATAPSVPSDYKCSSLFLTQYLSTENKLFSINSNTQNVDSNIRQFYINNNLFTPLPNVKCGCLLKNWDSIPGRDRSPSKRNASEMNVIEMDNKCDYENVFNYKHDVAQNVMEAKDELNALDLNNTTIKDRSVSPDLFNDSDIKSIDELNEANLCIGENKSSDNNLSSEASSEFNYIKTEMSIIENCNKSIKLDLPMERNDKVDTIIIDLTDENSDEIKAENDHSIGHHNHLNYSIYDSFENIECDIDNDLINDADDDDDDDDGDDEFNLLISQTQFEIDEEINYSMNGDQTANKKLNDFMNISSSSDGGDDDDDDDDNDANVHIAFEVDINDSTNNVINESNVSVNVNVDDIEVVKREAATVSNSNNSNENDMNISSSTKDDDNDFNARIALDIDVNDSTNNVFNDANVSVNADVDDIEVVKKESDNFSSINNSYENDMNISFVDDDNNIVNKNIDSDDIEMNTEQREKNNNNNNNNNCHTIDLTEDVQIPSSSFASTNSSYFKPYDDDNDDYNDDIDAKILALNNLNIKLTQEFNKNNEKLTKELQNFRESSFKLENVTHLEQSLTDILENDCKLLNKYNKRKNTNNNNDSKLKRTVSDSTLLLDHTSTRKKFKKSIFSKNLSFINESKSNVNQNDSIEIIDSDDELIKSFTTTTTTTSSPPIRIQNVCPLTPQSSSIIDENEFNNLNDKFIIKTRCITPKPNYERMSSPERLIELKKYGLKIHKKRQAIICLEHIYNQLHPFIELVNDENDKLKSVPMTQSHSQLSQSSLSGTTTTTTQTNEFNDNDCLPITTNNSCGNCNELKLVIGTGDMLLNESFKLKNNCKYFILPSPPRSKKISWCPIPLHIAWHNLINANPQLFEIILQYKPININEIRQFFKEIDLRYEIKDIISFFDEHCIAFRIDVPKNV